MKQFCHREGREDRKASLRFLSGFPLRFLCALRDLRGRKTRFAIETDKPESKTFYRQEHKERKAEQRKILCALRTLGGRDLLYPLQ